MRSSKKMEKLREYLNLLIEAKVPVFYYGETFEQEAENLLKTISRKLDLNLNVVPEILQIMPAIEREGIENGLLIFYLDEIKERREFLTKRFSPTQKWKILNQQLLQWIK